MDLVGSHSFSQICSALTFGIFQRKPNYRHCFRRRKHPKSLFAMALLERLASGAVHIEYQAQARIFKLPMELRMAVYDFVFRENILHFRNNLRYKKRGVPYCSAMWYAANTTMIL
jgi:hypothetical protein